jgi:hypothetical protein
MFVCLASILANCDERPVLSQSDVRGEDERIKETLSDAILNRVPSYTKSRNDRALVACIDWGGVTLNYVPVSHTFWTYTSETSDRTIFAGRLMRDALSRCEKMKVESGSDCECVELAKQNKSVLRVPDTVMQRLIEERILIKCRLSDGIVLDVSAPKCKEIGGAPK